MTRSAANITLVTRAGTVEPGLPVVVNILLGQPAVGQRAAHTPVNRTFAGDFSGRGGLVPLQIPKPANAKEVVGFKPDNAPDLRPPPRWGINE